MLKIGFIGPGSMGSFHVRSLKALAKEEDIEVTDIADVRQERLDWAKTIWPNAKEWHDGDELLDNADVDVVWVTTPSYLHAGFVIKALNKGCHVFSEKPLCLSEDEVHAILEAKRKSGKKAMVGMVVRFMWPYIKLKEIVDTKRFGNVRSIVMQRLSGNPHWSWNDWFNDEKKSGSVVMDLHIHDVDLLKYIFGDLKIEHVTAAKYKDTGMINQIITTFDIGDAKAVVEGVWHHCQKFPFIPSYRVEFDDACIIYDASKGERIYWTNWNNEDGYFEQPKAEFNEENKEANMNISDMGAYYIEDKYFIECIKEDKENEIASLESASESVLLCLKEYELAKKSAK